MCEPYKKIRSVCLCIYTVPVSQMLYVWNSFLHLLYRWVNIPKSIWDSNLDLDDVFILHGPFRKILLMVKKSGDHQLRTR